jgi:kelch-like protein 2/3
VQSAALRICLGAFRTSPIPSLHVEANELPLSLRRHKLTLQYITKLKSNPDNPTFKCVFEPSSSSFFEAKPSVIPSLGVRIKQKLLDTGVQFDNIAKYTISPIPPWLLEPPQFIYSLHDLGNKSETPPYIFHSKLDEILSVFDGYTRLYTDGSKDGPAVASAAVSGTRVFVKRLPNHSSIFSAEAHAILLALNVMEQSAVDRFVLLTDSLSCLQSIENRKLNHPLILEILNRLHQIISLGKHVVFVWLPSHVGLAGNTAADASAKAALCLPEADAPVPFSDYYPVINSHIRSAWQQSWNDETNNKLHAIEPVLKQPKPYHLPRRDELLIHRLRIGHTHLTHAFLLGKESPPECTPCGVPLTVEHILLYCTEFAYVRNRHFSVSTMIELFDRVHPHLIVKFIKEIGLYCKI